MDTWIKESEEKYRSLVETVPVGIVEIDLRGTIQFANDSYCRMLDFTSQELVGKFVPDLAPSDSQRQELQAYLKSTFQQQPPPSPWLGEHRTSVGNTIQVQVHWNYKKDEHGSVVGFIAVVTDITDRRKAREQVEGLNSLREDLLDPRHPSEKLKRITDGVVKIFDADFARIWLIRPGDRCDSGCVHAEVTKGPHICRYRDRCLHLVASSGRYTHLDGSIHGRVPFDCYKIGRVASGQIPKFLTNDVTDDPNVHDHEWAKSLGLVSFAGYRILSTDMQPVGVLGLFARHPISADEDVLLKGLGNTAAQVIQTNIAEEALIASEARYRLMFENLEDVYYETLLDGTIVEISPSVERVVGYQRSELLGTSIRDVYSDPQKRDTLIETILGDGAVQDYEILLRDKDDIDHHCSITARLTSDEKGSPRKICGILRDISERKRAEEEVNKLAAVVRHSSELVNLAKLNGQMLFLNEAGSRMLGIDPGEVTNHSILEVIPEDLLTRVQTELLPELMKGGTWEGDLRYRNVETGELTDVHAMCFTVKAPDSKAPLFLANVSLDITERKRAEQTLLKEKTFSDASLDSLPGIFYLFDEEGRLLRWNRNFEKVSGYTSLEISGMNPVDFFRGEDKRNVSERIREAFSKGGASVEAALVSKDGSKAPYFLTGKRMLLDGKVCLVGMGIDITQRKRLEEQLLRSQKMEAVGTLAGGIAHDFNNLLHVINGYAEMALFDIKEGDTGYSEFQEIKGAARSGAELTQSLLTFSRRVESKLRPLDLNCELQSVAKMLSRTLPKMIEIGMHLSEPLDTVNADPAQLQQVVMNLAVNARDAMTDGGKLVIETRNVFLDAEYCRAHPETKPGQYILLSVSDSGTGMVERTRRQIFDPFFTTKETGKGTGLGLSIVFGIVKSHGGTIGCYSEPGEGTTFNIYLPSFAADRESQDITETRILRRGSETILLVDDEESVRQMGEAILKRFGYSVLTAKNGKEGFDVLSREKAHIDLVILDLIMPEMGGRECLNEVMRVFPNTKVIIASGYAANGQIDRTLEEGAKAAVQKPYGARRLLEIVRRVLDEG
ncbi:PAS domain S-box protein [Thermodesulfobacteriota bacterium]